MIKIEKIYPRDIIAFFVLMFALSLIYLGINAIVSGIIIMIVTYYFTQRINGDINLNGNLNKVVGQLGLKINDNNNNLHIPKTQSPREINKEFDEALKKFPT